MKVVTTTELTWDNYVFWGHRAYSYSQSCRENSCFSARIHALNDGISNWWLSTVQCCVVLCGITPDSGRRRMQCYCIFVRIVTPVLSRVLLFSPRGVGPPDLSDSSDSELFNESSSFTLSESEVWNTLHHHVILLTLLQFLFSSVGLHRRCH